MRSDSTASVHAPGTFKFDDACDNDIQSAVRRMSVRSGQVKSGSAWWEHEARERTSDAKRKTTTQMQAGRPAGREGPSCPAPEERHDARAEHHRDKRGRELAVRRLHHLRVEHELVGNQLR